MDKLYIFGSMPLANVRLQNDQDPTGCFRGASYFNTQTGTYAGLDIAFATGGAHMKHPHVAIILLASSRHQTVHTCHDDPSLSVGTCGDEASCIALANLHLFDAYKARLPCTGIPLPPGPPATFNIFVTDMYCDDSTNTNS